MDKAKGGKGPVCVAGVAPAGQLGSAPGVPFPGGNAEPFCPVSLGREEASC